LLLGLWLLCPILIGRLFLLTVCLHAWCHQRQCETVVLQLLALPEAHTTL
jgi:hypothetical protein